MKRALKSFLLFMYILHAKGNFCDRFNLVNTRKSWRDAAQHCKTINGILMVPDEDKLQELETCSNNADIYNEAWVGKYKFLSPWLEIYGCYELHLVPEALLISAQSYIIIDNHPAICDNACGHNMFIGIMEDQCLCLGNNLSIISGYRTSADKCNISCNLDADVYCGGVDKITVYKNGLGAFSARNEQNKKNTCIQYGCESNTFVKTAMQCSTVLTMTCENGQITKSSNNWNLQLKDCINNRMEYAFLYHNRSGYCSADRQQVKWAWSGIFRSVVNDKTNTTNDYSVAVDVIKCFKLKKDNTGYVPKEDARCTDRKSFICDIGQVEMTTETSKPGSSASNNVDNITYISTTPESSTKTGTDEITGSTPMNAGSEMPAINNTGTIVGVAVTVLLVVILCIIAIFCLRKRYFQQRSSARKYVDKANGVNDQNCNPVKTDPGKCNEVNTDPYELAGPSTKIKIPLAGYANSHLIRENDVEKFSNLDKNNTPSNNFDDAKRSGKAEIPTGYHLAKLPGANENQIKNGYELAKIPQSFSNETPSDYEFADPAETNYSRSGVEYVYTDTKEGEYDTLHDQKRKINNGENNVYAHTNIGDIAENEYDVTGGQFNQHDANHYDHTTFCSDDYAVAGHNDKEHDPYDHSNI